jgi:O-antigen/teichoic acid export membrane protein
MHYAVLIEDLVQPISNFILVFVFLGLEYLFWGSIYAYVLSYILAFGVGIIYLRRMFQPSIARIKSSPVSIKKLIEFSFPASMSGVFVTLMIWMDRFAVGLLLPTSEAGIYQSASQLSLLFAIMLSAIGTVFAPLLAAIIASGSMNRIAELYRVSTKWAFYIGIPIFSVMVVFADEIMNALYGEAYLGGAAVLIILAVGQIVNLATGPVGPLLVMSGHQKEWFRITLLFLIADIGLLMVLIPISGIVGAAIVTSVSIFGVYAVGVFQIRKSLKILPYDRRFIKAVVILIVILTILLTTRSFLTIAQDWLWLLLGFLLAMASFVLLLRIFGWDPEDEEIFLLLRNRIFNPRAGSSFSNE